VASVKTVAAKASGSGARIKERLLQVKISLLLNHPERRRQFRGAERITANAQEKE
jgi:hypothetical protein